MRPERRFRYLVTRDFKPLAYYHSVVNSNKKQIPQRRWIHELRQRYTRKKKSTGLECGHVQKMKKTIASIKFSVNPGYNERIVTKLRITL